jgi:signal transduction histidine kinase
VTVDITARKHAEFEAAQLRHQVTHAGRVTSLGELAATLAHELNQPLGAMVSNAEAARVFLTRVPPDLVRIQATLDDIVRDGQRAGGVVHRIRRLLQKQVIEMQPLDVHRLVDEVVGLARPFAMSREIELGVDVEPGVPSPHGDAVQIQQVLINLMLNAMDAVMEQPAHARHVTVRAGRRDASTVELSVIDTGSGIPVERLPRIFDPFFTTKTSGMGMGLAICRTIVQAHGGDIRVENNPRGGAIVRFTLPVSGLREERAS